MEYYSTHINKLIEQLSHLPGTWCTSAALIHFNIHTLQYYYYILHTSHTLHYIPCIILHQYTPINTLLYTSYNTYNITPQCPLYYHNYTYLSHLLTLITYAITAHKTAYKPSYNTLYKLIQPHIIRLNSI